MRLGLGTALLIVCLCSQGCLSFVFLGSSPNPYARRRKVACLVSGIISGVAATVGGVAIYSGQQAMRRDTENIGWYRDGWGTAAAGGHLLISGILPGLISFVHGLLHLAERVKGAPESNRYRIRRGARRFGPALHQQGGRSIVGLPDLGHIDPRKLPIQKVNWYWVQEE